jgi:EAL domain-containing protein (putative c-di-GMP-specific phosphodiesterase class I)
MTAASSPVGRSQLRVLLVDDDAMVLAMNRLWLERMGVRAVETALNGNEALDVLGGMAEPPDVIISDLNMPRMDGVELLRHVAERRVGAGVIISSGEEPRLLASVHQLALHHGLTVLGAMPKPLTYESLVKLLNDFAGVQSAPVPLAVARITEDEFDAGIAGDALTLLYQPKVLRADSRVVGVEALARWNHPERGLLGAAAFVPVAEETGRTGALTAAVLRQATAECGRWRAAGLDLPVSVNVSADDLGDVTLPDFASTCVADAGLFSSAVTLEVTESRIMKNLKATMETLSRLRLKGFGLSIDDFGTGYASLEQLKRAPFTEVKVDRAFVHGASTDSTSRAILESSIALGKKLKMRVVAEGAETEADWDLLGALECDVVQGYFVARPMAGKALPDWLSTLRL